MDISGAVTIHNSTPANEEVEEEIDQIQIEQSGNLKSISPNDQQAVDNEIEPKLQNFEDDIEN